MDSRRGSGAVTTAWTTRWSRGWAALVAATLALVAVLAGAPGVAQGADEPRAVLSVLKSVSATSAQPGDRVTWTIDVTCESIVTMCVDAVMADSIPEPFEIVADGVSVQGQRTGSAQVTVSGRDVQGALPADADGALLVYDPDAYGEAAVQVTPSSAQAAQVDPTVAVDGDRIRVTFPAGTRLLPGERVVVTVPLAVRPGTPAGAVLTNRFVLTAADDMVREATATVDVVAMATYLRVKDVAEDVAPGGTPTGVVSTVGGDCVAADGFYRNPCLVGTAPGGTETWRLRVANTDNLPTAAISLVDVLPHDGDTGTSRSQSSSSRGSAWAPEFLGDLTVQGVPTGGKTTVSYLLDGQTCRFSGDPRSADPYGTGCAADVWTPADQVTDLSTVRGVRVDVDLAAANLQPGETVTVAFRTRSVTPAAGDATGSTAPAWNTMVVHTASVAAAGLVHETLEPDRAGVFVQPVADPGGTTPPGPREEVLGVTVTRSEVSAVSDVLAVTGTEAAALAGLALAALGLGALLLRARGSRRTRRG